MARVGRPPKPIEEKIRTGFPGHSKPKPDRATLTVLPAATAPPEPARPLAKPGRAMWDRTWGAGATWLAAHVDAEQVLIMCEQMDERTQLRGMVLNNPDDWRSRTGLRALDAQIMEGLSVLGFNPTERSRLGVAEVKAASTLDRIAERRASRG